MAETIVLRVLKKRKMSRTGFERLKSLLKLNFKPEVYPPVFTGKVRCDLIETETDLARWLYMKFGEGFYIILPYKYDRERKQKQLGKAIARVGITAVLEKEFDFQFTDTRGISRYGWWLGV